MIVHRWLIILDSSGSTIRNIRLYLLNKKNDDTISWESISQILSLFFFVRNTINKKKFTFYGQKITVSLLRGIIWSENIVCSFQRSKSKWKHGRELLVSSAGVCQCDLTCVCACLHLCSWNWVGVCMSKKNFWRPSANCGDFPNVVDRSKIPDLCKAIVLFGTFWHCFIPSGLCCSD